MFQFETILLVNVYMPCDYGNVNSFIDYKSNLVDLESALASNSFDKLIIVGDFNCDPYKGRFYREFTKLADNLSLCVRDVENLPPDSYTYVSRNTVCSTSWLDHILTSANCQPFNIVISYGFTFDDHIPISFELESKVSLDYYLPSSDTEGNKNFLGINWDKVSFNNIRDYSVLLDDLGGNCVNSALSCDVSYCTNANHLIEIEQAFDYAKNILLFSSNECLPGYSHGRGAQKVVPGWNDHCKHAHEEARLAFLNWHRGGRIRDGHLFINMKKSRASFRRLLKYCKLNESKIRQEKFLAYFRHGNKSQFWREVKKLNKGPCVSNIDGNYENCDIIRVFEEKFRKILDNDPESGTTVEEFVDDSPSSDDLFLSFFHESIIDLGIDRLSTGQGFDCVHSKHLKYSGRSYRELLSRIFSAMMIHSYIPKEMLRGYVKPVLKDKSTSRTSSDNCRPIMNSSNFLKLFEYCLLPILQRELDINSLQFGFTRGSDCQSAITFAKEVISYYTRGQSNVHCAALDLSKAFDMVDVEILVNKLCNTGLPSSVVKIIQYMLKNSFVNVCFVDQIGEEWNVRRGVRQGGILSPILFNFYINECLVRVSEMSEGCKLCFQPANIVGYADDLLLLAPSARGLQKMLDVSMGCIANLRLRLNVSKSRYIVFRGKRSNNITTSVNINGSVLERVHSIKYLGVYLSDDMRLDRDIDRVLDLFLRQFNSMFYKFRFTSTNVLSFLFKRYTSSFYGLDMWSEHLLMSRHIHKVSVAYHKSVKKVANLNLWDSNHRACESIGVDTFPHLVSKRLLSHYVTLMTTNCPALKVLRYHFLYNSRVKTNLDKVFVEQYGLSNFIENDVDALYARIMYVQRTEPRSHYFYCA